MYPWSTMICTHDVQNGWVDSGRAQLQVHAGMACPAVKHLQGQPEKALGAFEPHRLYSAAATPVGNGIYNHV